MNRQFGSKASSDVNDPLSLLVHAADSQRSTGKGNPQAKPNVVDHQGVLGREDLVGVRGMLPASFEEQLAQRQAAAALRAEALHHQGILSQLRAGNPLGSSGVTPDHDFFPSNAATAGLVAAQQQQAAALALASDIRNAVAAAQLRQAAQFQNHDFLLARTAALQQLGAFGAAGAAGLEHLKQEIEFQKLEEWERRQLLAAAAAANNGNSMVALAAARQHELQEAHLRQEQLDRHIHGMGAAEALIERAALRAQTDAKHIIGNNQVNKNINNISSLTNPSSFDSAFRNASTEKDAKDAFQKTPGSVVVPCRARGMPMDHNFKTAYFVIPENVVHGEELICSYFACRNAGIKFRYCTHCKVPVAKRNFRKRHKHGKAGIGNDDSDDEEVDEEEEFPKENKNSFVSKHQESSAKNSPMFSPQKAAGPSIPSVEAIKSSPNHKKIKQEYDEPTPSNAVNVENQTYESGEDIEEQEVMDSAKDQNDDADNVKDQKDEEVKDPSDDEVKAGESSTTQESEKNDSESEKEGSNENENDGHIEDGTDDSKDEDVEHSYITFNKDDIQADNKSTEHQIPMPVAPEEESAPIDDSDKSRFTITPKRQSLWDELLYKRPPTKNGDAVSAWLMEVLSISDLDIALEANPSVKEKIQKSDETNLNKDRLMVTSAVASNNSIQQSSRNHLSVSNALSTSSADASKEPSEIEDKGITKQSGTKKRSFEKLKMNNVQNNDKENGDDSDEDFEDDSNSSVHASMEASKKAKTDTSTDKVCKEDNEDSSEEESKTEKIINPKVLTPEKKELDPVPTAAVVSAASPSVKKKDVGSFAEWKDRKKNKSLPKKVVSLPKT